VKTKKPIIIVLGEPNSVFTELLSKVLGKLLGKNKIRYPIILIGSKNLVISQLKILNKKLDFTLIKPKEISSKNIKKGIYLIDVKYGFKKPFENISFKSKNYISKCFEIGLDLINKKKSDIIINGPISKKHFLEKKYPGITEYIHDKSKNKLSKKPVMLIFNKKLSVSPVTTHIPLKNVSNRLNRKVIENNILEINNFYKKNFRKKPKIAVLGINPHCETFSKINEERHVIKPVINKLKKKKIGVFGPYASDTFFINSNIKKYNSIVGMYHDQVLTPFKTIFNFDASNITLGLPFLRMSVDHGPNESMIGKNLSNTKSLENIFEFIYSLK